MTHTVYIGIGSNLGNRRVNCETAVEKISAFSRILSTSKWFENPPLTKDRDEKQNKYINGVVKVETALKPVDLLYRLKEIETEMGRPPEHERWSSRTIDLDILFYDDTVLDDPRLKIPHPEIDKRLFVLRPLCDIEPDLVHPVLGVTVGKLLLKYK